MKSTSTQLVGHHKLVEDFKEYFPLTHVSSSLMFNPPMPVSDLVDWQFEKGFAPKTLTELYTGLVHTLLLRWLTTSCAQEKLVSSSVPEERELTFLTALA